MDVFALETWAWVALAGAVLVLPGTALYITIERLFGGKGRNFHPEALLYGSGLGVAFWPLLLLYVSLLGQRFTPTLLWAVLLLALLPVVWLVPRNMSAHRPPPGSLAVGFTLAGLTLTVLAFRLGDIQGLATPLFGDSLHHTMIATIITDTGRVPGGYQPYVPVDTFTYHFGFHTLAAVLAQLADITPAAAVLIMGQALIAMSLPVAYLFGKQLFSSRLAGLSAALLTGFVSIMPGYYVNWGRYTQLAGQILLPVALALLLRVVSHRRLHYQGGKRYEVALAAFCVAGLVVTHYRVLIFYALFLAALGVWYLVTRWGQWHILAKTLGRVLATLIAGLLAVAPWLWNLWVNYLPGVSRRLGTVSGDYLAAYNSDDNIPIYLGRALPVIALAGLVIAGAQLARKRGLFFEHGKGGGGPVFSHPVAALATATWACLLWASVWAVPGAIGSLAVAISLYLPLCALGGFGIAILAEQAAKRLHMTAYGLPLALLAAIPICLVLFGTGRLSDASYFSYIHEADLKAFKWVAANTPHTAGFLIPSEISFVGRGVTASDAGMWLPLLAGRNVSVPALASWTERPLDPEFFTDTRKLAAYTQPPSDPDIQRYVSLGRIPQPRPPDDPETLALMRKLGITHVYSGAPGGVSKARLDLEAMRKDTCHYKLVYAPQDGVYIFEVVYEGGECERDA